MITVLFRKKIGRIEILKPLLKAGKIILICALIPFWRIKTVTQRRTNKLN